MAESLRVFVSSTFAEFREERQAVARAIRKLPLVTPVLFEEMPSGATIFEVINAELTKADIFVVLLGARYSESVLLEYEVARAQNKPILVYIKKMVEREIQLEQFLNLLKSEFLISVFRSSEELEKLISTDIAKLLIDRYSRFGLDTTDFTDSEYKEELEAKKKRRGQDRNLCFVVMPIGKQGTREYQEFKNVFELIIKPAVEIDAHGKPTGLKCERADQELRPGNIPKDIIEKLASAEIVIADLTKKNPNVFYELGVRHALRQKTIMIARSVDDLPFDVSNYRVVPYDPIVGFAEDSLKRLRLTVRTLMSTKNIKDSPVLDWV